MANIEVEENRYCKRISMKYPVGKEGLDTNTIAVEIRGGKIVATSSLTSFCDALESGVDDIILFFQRVKQEMKVSRYG